MIVRSRVFVHSTQNAELYRILTSHLTVPPSLECLVVEGSVDVVPVDLVRVMNGLEYKARAVNVTWGSSLRLHLDSPSITYTRNRFRRNGCVFQPVGFYLELGEVAPGPGILHKVNSALRIGNIIINLTGQKTEVI